MEALLAARSKKRLLQNQRKLLKRREQQCVNESSRFVEKIKALEAVEALNRKV
jgi:hypothetical protein